MGVSLLLLPLNEGFAFLSRSSEDSGVGRTEGSAQKAATPNSQLCKGSLCGEWVGLGGTLEDDKQGPQELSQQVR